MKKRFNLVTVAVLMALMAVITYIITQSYVLNSYNAKLTKNAEIQNKLKVFLEALGYIEEQFIEPYDLAELQEGAIEGMVSRLPDVWSGYESAESYQKQLESRSNTATARIGVEVMRHEDGSILIKEVDADTPAEKAGLLPGDCIVAVDGKRIGTDIGYDAAVLSVGGEVGQSVSLTIRRDDGEFTVDVVRQLISVDVVRSRIFDSAGYVYVSNFNTRADTDFIAAVDEMLAAEVDSLIVDLRGNPGGDLGILVNMLDYLLPPCRIISLEYKDGETQTYDATEGSVDLPIVVLVNEGSVSAAEYFAACLSEYGRAYTIGQKTGGKGNAQVTFQLQGGSALRLSTCRYTLPSGQSLKETGLAPDLEVAFDAEAGDVLFRGRPSANPEADPQMLAALRYLGVVN